MSCPYKFRWATRVLVLTALLAILPVAIGATFWHTDAPGQEATCSICHVAHMPALTGTAATVLASPTTVGWLNLAEIWTPNSTPSSLDSPPRAPPV